jgi:lipopolysaccharide transport system permease protein
MSTPLTRSRVDLFRALLIRNLKLRAKRSALGLAWPVLAPVVLLVLYIFVFDSVFHVPVRHYGEYLYAGLLPWTFLTQSLGSTITAVSSEPEIVRRARFPYEFLPMASTTSMFIFFLVTLSGFLAYLAVVGRLHLVVLPVLFLPLIAVYLLVSAFGLLLSFIDVYSRDLRQVLANLLTVWFFLVPIVYRQDMVTKRLWFLEDVDPANLIVGQFRAVLYYGKIAQPGHMVLMLVICVSFFGVCLALFHRASGNIPKDV